MSLFCPAIEFDIGFVLHNTDVNFTHLSERANNKLDEVKLNKDYESMYYYKIHWGGFYKYSKVIRYSLSVTGDYFTR